AGEDSGRGGHERPGIDRNQATGRNRHAAFFPQGVEVGGLPDGQDHGVAVDHRLTAGVEFRIESSVFIEDPFGFYGLEAGGLSVGADHAFGAVAGVNDDAFFLGLFDLFHGGGHLFAAFDA